MHCPVHSTGEGCKSYLPEDRRPCSPRLNRGATSLGAHVALMDLGVARAVGHRIWFLGADLCSDLDASATALRHSAAGRPRRRFCGGRGSVRRSAVERRRGAAVLQGLGLTSLARASWPSSGGCAPKDIRSCAGAAIVKGVSAR
jgi:hypothetical protein